MIPSEGRNFSRESCRSWVSERVSLGIGKASKKLLFVTDNERAWDESVVRADFDLQQGFDRASHRLCNAGHALAELR